MSLSCASAFVKFYSLTGSKLPDLEVQNDLNRNPETSEHFSEIRRAEEKISLFSGSSLSVTSCLSNEANTNLIAHNNDRLPLRTSSLNDETKTNLIAHNNSGFTYWGCFRLHLASCLRLCVLGDKCKSGFLCVRLPIVVLAR